MSATEARVHFGELLRRVAEDGETITVEHAGKPRVVVLPLEEYQRLLTRGYQDPDWLVAIDQFRDRLKARLGDREIPPSEDVIREMREERDEQIDAAVRGLC